MRLFLLSVTFNDKCSEAPPKSMFTARDIGSGTIDQAAVASHGFGLFSTFCFCICCFLLCQSDSVDWCCSDWSHLLLVNLCIKVSSLVFVLLILGFGLEIFLDYLDYLTCFRPGSDQICAGPVLLWCLTGPNWVHVFSTQAATITKEYDYLIHTDGVISGTNQSVPPLCLLDTFPSCLPPFSPAQ